jgi:hypothetical protein
MSDQAVWGAGGRRFNSSRPDQFKKSSRQAAFWLWGVRIPGPQAQPSGVRLAQSGALRKPLASPSRPDQFFKDLERFLESFLSKIISRV